MNGKAIMKEFTHLDENGKARMVDVSDKAVTKRTAVAGARVLVNKETFALISDGGIKKGDVLSVAQLAGVMGAKKTADLIPLCHNITTDSIDVSCMPEEETHSVRIVAKVTCTGRTGAEMEALTAASVAALTVYDMCKAVQKDMEITQIRLLEKTGGVHGDYVWDSKQQ